MLSLALALFPMLCRAAVPAAAEAPAATPPTAPDPTVWSMGAFVGRRSTGTNETNTAGLRIDFPIWWWLALEVQLIEFWPETTPIEPYSAARVELQLTSPILHDLFRLRAGVGPEATWPTPFFENYRSVGFEFGVAGSLGVELFCVRHVSVGLENGFATSGAQGEGAGVSLTAVVRVYP